MIRRHLLLCERRHRLGDQRSRDRWGNNSVLHNDTGRSSRSPDGRLDSFRRSCDVTACAPILSHICAHSPTQFYKSLRIALMTISRIYCALLNFDQSCKFESKKPVMPISHHFRIIQFDILTRQGLFSRLQTDEVLEKCSSVTM